MPKAEKGSVKDLANRMKAKGLQKLKFFCQMCEKQCRDANGFKCHLTSETHLRNMKIFSDNAGGILDEYSKDFEKNYITTLRMRHGTKKVNANNVYQEVIQDKQHIHMNATHWTTLTDFVQYLGRTGKCVVEETDRGWFVSYIERDAGIIARQEAQQRREAADRQAELRQAERMQIQREEAAKALDRAGGSLSLEATSIDNINDIQPVKVALGAAGTTKNATSSMSNRKITATVPNGVFGDDDDDEEEEEEDVGPPEPKIPSALAKALTTSIPSTTTTTMKSSSDASRSLPPSSTTQSQGKDKSHKHKLEDGTDSKWEKKHKKKREDVDNSLGERGWLYRDIVVRVIAKDLAGGKYFRRKAVVDKLIDDYTAEVEILDSDPDTRDGGDILRLDQADLETVVPKWKKDHNDSRHDDDGDDKRKSKKRKTKQSKVRILLGKYRGKKATVEGLDKKNYTADLLVRLEDEDKLIREIPYENFSQIA